MDNSQKMIDEFLAPDSRDWKKTVQNAGWVIYYLCILTFSAHQLNWTLSVMEGWFAIIGVIGGFGLTGNAIFLPRAIKEWTVETAHRSWAIFAYAVDIALMIGFVWTNTNLLRGVTTEAVAQYAYWIAPITGMVPVITWGVLWILDPAEREKHQWRKMERKAHAIRLRSELAREVAEAEIYSTGVMAPYQNDQKEPKQPESMIYSGWDPGFDSGQDLPPAEYLDELPEQPELINKISGNGMAPKV